MGVRTLDFRDHRRELGENRWVYAVVSRRCGGLSIGVNLNTDKRCNFDCPYCQVNRTVPGWSGTVDPSGVAYELDELLAHLTAGTLWDHAPFDSASAGLRTLRDISVAGDGEPTTCPELDQVIQSLAEVRNRYQMQQVPIRLLTNATFFHLPRVQRALQTLDRHGGEIWAKLDAGTSDYFREVNGTEFSFTKVLE
ncbi:MAG: radical SAM protein, partial [Myxococcota bacterium]|nr:radical SAM protein [Myxococcota bacterium]